MLVVEKLVKLSNKNKLTGIIVKSFCYMAFKAVSGSNEISAFFRSKGIGDKKYKPLLKYKDIHKNKRCFIICTGPSLTIADLESIKNEYSFGMNSIIKIYDKTNFRPTYYGLEDHLVFDAMKDIIFNYYKNKDNVFVSNRILHHFSIDKSWNVYPYNMSYHAYDRWFKSKYWTKYCEDIHRMVYDAFSVTHSLMTIAIYMGFTEIYLLGADCSFPKGQPHHFVETGTVDADIDTSRDRNIAGYLGVKKYADAHGVKIYNATRGGELEVFPRVKLENVLEESK